MAQQQSIVLKPDNLSKIEDIRAAARPIMSRNKLVNELIAEALAAREAK